MYTSLLSMSLFDQTNQSINYLTNTIVSNSKAWCMKMNKSNINRMHHFLNAVRTSNGILNWDRYNRRVYVYLWIMNKLENFTLLVRKSRENFTPTHFLCWLIAVCWLYAYLHSCFASKLNDIRHKGHYRFVGEQLDKINEYN